MPKPAVFVGIDVAQATLVVAVRPQEQCWTVPNDATGLATLQRRLQRQAPTLIVLEATGGLERLAASTLGAAGLPVAVVNPRQVRDFAKATGRLAKTDALDAQVLAHFAAAVPATPTPAAGYPDRRPGRGARPASPGGQDAYGRAEPADAGHRGAGAPAHPSPRALAGAGAGPRRRRPGSGLAGQPALAGAGRLAAQCAWCGEGADAHPAGGVAGAGHVVAPAGGDVGRSGGR